MHDRDKIQALWVNLMLTMNALEELGEGLRTSEGEAQVTGTSGAVIWAPNDKCWAVELP